MRKYKCLSQQVFTTDNYKLVPIRDADKYAILEWRNSQVDILRQDALLTEAQQEKYFKEVVASLFTKEQPKQILFSFLAGETLIGYGGLVHINWESKHAEISFLLSNDTNISEDYQHLFDVFLKLIESVAAKLSLHKIFTFGYTVDEERFFPLQKNQFTQEALLKRHIKIKEQLFDVKIYAKFIDEYSSKRD